MRNLFLSYGALMAISLSQTFVLARESAETNRPSGGGIVICVHPKCDEMEHKANMGPECRSVTGHSGTWNESKTQIDVCAACQKEHQADSSLCQSTEVTCRKKRPVAD